MRLSHDISRTFSRTHTNSVKVGKCQPCLLSQDGPHALRQMQSGLVYDWTHLSTIAIDIVIPESASLSTNPLLLRGIFLRGFDFVTRMIATTATTPYPTSDTPYTALNAIQAIVIYEVSHRGSCFNAQPPLFSVAGNNGRAGRERFPERSTMPASNNQHTTLSVALRPSLTAKGGSYLKHLHIVSLKTQRGHGGG